MDHRAEPELLFYAPVPGHTTAFYACSVRDGEAPAAARELLTADNLSAEHVVLSPTPPCHGLTLIFEARAAEYHVCNLSTGDHVTLPPCEPAAEVDSPLQFLDGARFHNIMTPWFPFERSSAGLAFDAATGEHKVVRLFKKPSGEASCEVYTLGGAEADGWRPCAGQVMPHVGSFLVGMPPVSLDGFLYWLRSPYVGYAEVLEEKPILSFNVSTEQFGWVHMPPELARRTSHLANLDGSLCAVVDNRCFFELYELYTWSGAASTSPSWSPRCSINLQSLPEQVSDELLEERDVIPLCSGAGGGGKGKILLATGRHKVFAYDGERGTVERVFRMQDFVDFPEDHIQARLLLNVGLHEERVGDAVHLGGEGRLQVKLGRRGNTVVKREASVEHHDGSNRCTLDMFKRLAASRRANATHKYPKL
uniref:F-box associated beta-propeller type 3 domain-containing protein n=1 Tax=Oryza punctata TaxID=4537 RepID=A0A0E0M4L1_ORYPU